MDQTRTAVLLDPYPLWLDALESVIRKAGVDVVGTTTSSSRALQLVDEHAPEVFVTALEVSGEGGNGIACLKAAQERRADIRGIIVAESADPADVDAALSAGAAAYVVKTAHPEDIASAVRQAFEHSMFLSSSPRQRSTAAVVPLPEAASDLTRRELEILALVAEGHSNSQLARMLWVTEQTVKFHLSNIYRKLDVANRTEASRWAQRHGLLADDVRTTVVSVA